MSELLTVSEVWADFYGTTSAPGWIRKQPELWSRNGTLKRADKQKLISTDRAVQAGKCGALRMERILKNYPERYVTIRGFKILENES